MIFRQTGLKSNVLKVFDTDKTALETLASTNTPTISLSQDEEIKRYKANNMMYFISGDIKPNEDGTYIRNDSNLNSRDLIVIDIENTGLISQEIQDIIQERLESYKYLLYSTISHKQNNPRLRLVLEPSREILKDEYKPTIQHVIQLLNIKYDTSSCTWSQLQGLPIAVSDNEHIFIKHLDGEAYPVQEAVKKKKKTASYKVDKGVSIADEDYKEMFNRYLELDYENINTEDDNNYNRALGILLSLSRDVCYNIISEKVAYECSDLLANIGATPDEYKQGNLNKINHAIRSWESDSNFFENGQSYSMLQRFEIVGNEKDKNFLYYVRYKQNKPISSTGELHWRLFTTGEQWRVKNTKIDKDGNEKVLVMNFNIISSILKKHIPMKLTGETEDTSIIYCYNFSEGIYTGQEAYINRAIAKLEFRFDPRKYTQVYKFLKTQLPFLSRLEDKNIIAVNNGVFNNQTKQLEPFNPNYFITSKLATNYNIHAIENYEAIRKDYHDVDDWFLSIGNGDEDIVKLLWEVVNEAINPNHTREKMVILYGEGNNGKGTFQAMLTNLIGIENISTLTPQDFSGEFKLEMLLGKVCNIGDDISNKYLDDISILMSIITGDPIPINRKGKSVISARLKLLNIFSANRLPKIRNKSQGAYRRFLIIPFNADFNGKVQDRRIKEEYLKNEIVLEYILYKALHLNFEKFSTTKATDEMLEEYKEDNDYLYSFTKDWYAEKKLHEVERVPVPLIKDMYRCYLTVNYYDSKITSSFGKDLAVHLNNIYKEVGYKYKVERSKIRVEDRGKLVEYLSPVERQNMPDNLVHCIVKIQ
ncbi:phage/plasmid primase, P4 family domain protein [Gemella haemolysans]|uniref:Phage/plasmid primase, P4 family domain protein n=1 Tax=Gemella haemolysans TaxID=1379 RepID=A0A133ZXU8_9BACL|nr:phage/plasmid primase, P4 family [Gemella haemolysans]KXB60265.1 phage/plasmid primase, P4 family domain protein [Gemella haemolysans]